MRFWKNRKENFPCLDPALTENCVIAKLSSESDTLTPALSPHRCDRISGLAHWITSGQPFPGSSLISLRWQGVGQTVIGRSEKSRVISRPDRRHSSNWGCRRRAKHHFDHTDTTLTGGGGERGGGGGGGGLIWSSMKFCDSMMV